MSAPSDTSPERTAGAKRERSESSDSKSQRPKTTTNARQWLPLDLAPFQHLANQVHADEQWFLRPPPNTLTVAERSDLRQGKRCGIVRSRSLLM